MICGNPVRSVLLLATIAVLVSACGSATITGRKGSDGPPASSNASLGRWLEDHVGALNALLVAATLPESHPNSSFSERCDKLDAAAAEVRQLPSIPSANVQAQWRVLLSNLDAAVETCMTNNTAMVTRLDSEMLKVANSLGTLFFGASVPPLTSKGRNGPPATILFPS